MQICRRDVAMLVVWSCGDLGGVDTRVGAPNRRSSSPSRRTTELFEAPAHIVWRSGSGARAAPMPTAIGSAAAIEAAVV